MISILKRIPLISNVQCSSERNVILMQVDNFQAKASVYQLMLVIAILLKRKEGVSPATLHYTTLLLAGHPDIHDYALQYQDDSWWLLCYYDKERDCESLAEGIEKHLALSRYLQGMIAKLEKRSSTDKYEYCK